MKAGNSYRTIASSRSSLQSLPMEWLDSRSWRLPSGQALAEFALQAGFLAPLLLKRDVSRHRSTARTSTASGRAAAKEC